MQLEPPHILRLSIVACACGWIAQVLALILGKMRMLIAAHRLENDVIAAWRPGISDVASAVLIVAAAISMLGVILSVVAAASSTRRMLALVMGGACAISMTIVYLFVSYQLTRAWE